MRKPILFVFLLLLCMLWQHIDVLAQNQRIVDSLENKLKQLQSQKLELRHNKASIADSAEANLLYILTKTYWNSNPDKAMDYAKQTLALSSEIGYKKGIANA